MPSARFLRRAQFFRIPQEDFRCRQTHPALACDPQGAEDNDATVHLSLLLHSTLTYLGRHFDDHCDGHAKANQAQRN